MSALASISLSMHRLRFAKKRAGAWLLAVCWLLLNSQLAIANHGCDLQFTAETPAEQHMMHMQATDPVMDNMQAAGPLCEQHCIPEPMQQDHGSLALAAMLPASSELRVVAPAQQVQFSRAAWQTPPIAGPPAEIVFCRFRE